MEKTIIKPKYNMINTLDRALYELEGRAEKIGYEIDDDILYIEMCTILTEADFSGRKKIDSTFWWKLFGIVDARMKGEI